MNFIPISWQQLEEDTILLAKKLKSFSLDEIISISRGGMIVSRILSDLLDLPISHIALHSYDSLKQEREPMITQASTRTFNGEKILLVDELADTGKTFLRAKEYLRTLPISSVTTAALYFKPQTSYIPNFFVRQLDGWIILPYEHRETKRALVKELGVEKAQGKLAELGIKDWEACP